LNKLRGELTIIPSAASRPPNAAATGAARCSVRKVPNTAALAFCVCVRTRRRLGPELDLP
jgi:hypothetical protein